MNARPKLSATLLFLGLLSVRPAPAQQASELAVAAAQAMRRGDYAAAERSYRDLLRLEPGGAELYSNLGLACYSQKKLSLAAQAFEEALRLKPALLAPNLFLGQIRLKQGRAPEALPLLETVVKADPGQREAHRLLGAALVGMKRYDQALQEYEKLLAFNPRDMEAYHGLGRIYIELGQASIGKLAEAKGSGFVLVASAEHFALEPEWRSYALERYRQAVAASPDAPGLRVALGNMQLSAGDWEGARRSFQEELARDPFGYEALFGLSEVALHDGKPDEALQRLGEAVRIRPEYFDPLPSFSVGGDATKLRAALEPRAESGAFAAAFLLSQALSALGERERAAVYRARAERDRDRRIEEYRSGSAKADRLESPRTLGLKYLREKRYEDGVGILLPVVATVDAHVRTAVARALFALRRFKELVDLLKGAELRDPELLYLRAAGYKKLAAWALENMLELDPQSARAHQLLGDSFYVQDRFKDAASEYETAVKAQPGNPELYFVLGDTYLRLRQLDAAAEALTRATELDPSDAEACLMLGRTLVLLKRSEPAITALRRALELDPGSAEAHAQMGKALILRGRKQEAARELELGAASDKDGSVHYQLFKLYTELGQEKKAKDALLVYRNIKTHQ